MEISFVLDMHLSGICEPQLPVIMRAKPAGRKSRAGATIVRLLQFTTKAISSFWRQRLFTSGADSCAIVHWGGEENESINISISGENEFYSDKIHYSRMTAKLFRAAGANVVLLSRAANKL